MIAGGKIRFCAECAVYQEAITDWKLLFIQRIRWAIGNFESLFIYLPDDNDKNDNNKERTDLKQNTWVKK